MTTPAPPSYFDRKNPNVNLRSSQVEGGPPSPLTPRRTTGSTFSSPASGYRPEEELLIIELGSRSIRGGFAGDSNPRCCLYSGSARSQKVGDYSRWTALSKAPPVAQKASLWGREFEFWVSDTRTLDLGLVDDNLERAVREAYSRHLLVDAKSKRVALVVPSVLPLPLLERIISIFYRKFLVPSISLFPAPALSVVAAGTRSGLVVDIGWSETIITAIYEYREVRQRRSTRAMKLAALHTARLLMRYDKHREKYDLEDDLASEGRDEILRINIDHAEDVLIRMAWCQTMAEADEACSRPHRRPGLPGGRQMSGTFPVDTPQAPPRPAERQSKAKSDLKDVATIPLSHFCLPVESSLFADGKASYLLDDHESTLPALLFGSLLSLSSDVRGTCMSRIVFTGGGSNIPGLRSRLLDELNSTVQHRGWDLVTGNAADRYRDALQEMNYNRQRIAREQGRSLTSAERRYDDVQDGVPAALVMPGTHAIDEKLTREAAQGTRPGLSGVIRALETLGPWAGASLAAGLRVKGVVEVDRESFLKHGLAAAGRLGEGIMNKRQSHVSGLSRNAGDGNAWSLGIWA